MNDRDEHMIFSYHLVEALRSAIRIKGTENGGYDHMLRVLEGVYSAILVGGFDLHADEPDREYPEKIKK